ncbi:MAG: PTS sugar transporter subunit IIA [Planctomycetes bacterium]|nr:PTS sugar transporter subunit IIA [Planctomycetota bacterium]
MTYSDLFGPETVLLNLDEADSSDVLLTLAKTIVSLDPALNGKADELHAALLEREARGSTGSQGVGIPHIKMAATNKVTAVVGVHSEGVDFNALDGELVHVFFSVVRPEEGADEHLDLLRWIAGIAQHEDFVSFSCQATKPEQIIDLLTELSAA